MSCDMYGDLDTILSNSSSELRSVICNNETFLDSCLDACEQEDCNDSGDSTLDIVYTVVIQVLVFLLVFGLAGSVGVYIGLLSQFILMPLIGFLVVAMFQTQLEPLYAVSLLIICASPGGSYSNWWCNLVNLDLALSVAMTTVSTICSAFMLPVNVIIYVELGYKKLDPDNAQEIIDLLPYTTIAYTLANVIVAVTTGLYFGYKFPARMKTVNLIGTCAGFLSIILGVVASSTSCAEPWNQDAVVYYGTLLPVVLGIVLAMGFATLARLPQPQRGAVSIETAYQNTGISLAVALSLGPKGRAAAIIPVAYGAWEAVVFGIYALMCWYIGWTLSPPEEKLWVILVNSYQDRIETDPRYNGGSVVKAADSKAVVTRVQAE
ncbi:Ileal sodium/bile acid cotransporter [Hondaea fermentalgiana]|uniref:Ileal sodium/bile acid cotransporter n=1 Tax=Hondaea fermentalgiana TaxID=2315210 RepID=A0A2R5GGA7_9STRA|nr:Ileal sodium/bile acid cotransporter [Hondaea fermentalgiana]|eukprot:GBG29379.1 Ileal sodium/bile acid cotransporter [Hondaea fermentalgiana]